MMRLKYFCERVQQKLKAKRLQKEIFRKSIHMLGSFCPLFAYLTSTSIVVCTLFIIMLFYTLSELLRLKGKNIYCLSNVVKIANRERDEKRFSLGPITLSTGIIISLYFFPLYIATIAIFSLSFGDGIASLSGRAFGKRRLIFEGKTCAGSMACFLATFIAEIAFTEKIVLSLVIAFFTTIIELFPLKDFDNIAIPVSIAFLAQYLTEHFIPMF